MLIVPMLVMAELHRMAAGSDLRSQQTHGESDADAASGQ